jgi:anti-sigma factor RsiW
MSANLRRDPGACPSQLQLDRFFARELSDLERARMDRHLTTCAACAHELAQRDAEQAQFAPEPELLALLAARQRTGAAPAKAGSRARLLRRLATAGGLFAAAASALLVARSAQVRDDPQAQLAQQTQPAAMQPDRRGVRKGRFASVVAERAGVGRELGDGSRVQPGDRLQVTVVVPETRFVAVYSRDGSGVVSRYAPVEDAMVALPAGAQPLPNSTILDDVLGEELLAVFACARPLDDAALRAHLVGRDPAGCEVSRITLRKEPR